MNTLLDHEEAETGATICDDQGKTLIGSLTWDVEAEEDDG